MIRTVHRHVNRLITYRSTTKSRLINFCSVSVRNKKTINKLAVGKVLSGQIAKKAT